MGTHPIFESDFDCLTEQKTREMASANKIMSPENDQEFLSHTGDKTKVFCIDFFAEWCGPCKQIAPYFSQLATEYPSVGFLKVDIDKCENTAARFGVRAVPTFIFLKGGQTLATLKGINKDGLKNKLEELSKDSGAVPLEGAPMGMKDLAQFVDKTKTECLNDGSGSLACALEDEVGELTSDCDEQLLIRTAFIQPIKLHSIMFKAGGDIEQAPKTIRLFVNVTNPLDFDDAESAPATQELELDSKLLGTMIPLRFVKFQNVQNLTIFIKDNLGGGDVTALSRIQFIGQTMSQTNMNEFKRVAGKVGEGE